MNVLEGGQSDAWRSTPTPCTSDAWPFSPDIAVFEARRAIGNLVRTLGDGLNPPGIEASDVDPALRYIRATRALETIMVDLREDLVAEARTRSVTWEDIGRSLGIGRSGAQKRYNAGPPAKRLDQLRDEAFVSRLAWLAARPHQPPEEVVNGLDGATPLERLAYLARQALQTLADIDELLALTESDPENALGVLERACRRIARAMRAVAVDHAMWEAMAGWSGRPQTVDQVNYYAPTTYLLHAMRLLLFALLHEPEEGSTDIGRFRAFLAEVRRVYATVLLILERPDAGWAIPAPE